MYGRPYGKSLCHAWGASPIYLLGKYYLGVKPTAPGYSQYEIKPNLGGLQWMEGKVPTPNGEVVLYVSKSEIKVKAADYGYVGELVSMFVCMCCRDRFVKQSKCLEVSIALIE